MHRRRRQGFTPKQKADAVRMAREVGNFVKAARDLGPSASRMERFSPASNRFQRSLPGSKAMLKIPRGAWPPPLPPCVRMVAVCMERRGQRSHSWDSGCLWEA